MGAGASWLRAAGGDSTGAGRFTASQRGRVAENKLTKNQQEFEPQVRREKLNSKFLMRFCRWHQILALPEKRALIAVPLGQAHNACLQKVSRFAILAFDDAHPDQLLPVLIQ